MDTDMGTRSKRALCSPPGIWRAMWPALWMAPVVAIAGSEPTRVSTHVYRCPTDTGTVHFQGTPCGSIGAGELRVLEHVQPAVPNTRGSARSGASERGATRKSRGRRSRSVSSAGESADQSTPPTPRERRKSRREQTRLAAARCPATREDEAPTGSTQVAQAWRRHQALPSRTWLRNAGQWPAHCDEH